MGLALTGWRAVPWKRRGAGDRLAQQSLGVSPRGSRSEGTALETKRGVETCRRPILSIKCPLRAEEALVREKAWSVETGAGLARKARRQLLKTNLRRNVREPREYIYIIYNITVKQVILCVT